MGGQLPSPSPVNCSLCDGRWARAAAGYRDCLSGGELNRVEFLHPLAQFPERYFLDLPDALARYAELFADFLQCFPVATVQAEPLPEDRLLARVQCFDHFMDE